MDDDLEEESQKVKTTPKKPVTEPASHLSEPAAPGTPPKNKDNDGSDTAPAATTETGDNKNNNKKNKKTLRDRGYRNNNDHTNLPIQETPSKAIEEEFTIMTSESKM
jgi:hypothetical protein